MSGNNTGTGSPVQTTMDAVVAAWESTVHKIRQCKKEAQAQLEELAGLGPAAEDALPQFETSTAVLAAIAASPAPVSPAIAAESEGEDVDNKKDEGKEKDVDTSAITATTQTKSVGSRKSRFGTISSKKDVKGKDKAISKSPSPETFSPKTLSKMTKIVKNGRLVGRLPLIKPISTLKLASLSAAIQSGSTPGPPSSKQRPITPEPVSETEESETEYLSVLEFNHGLSSPPDASSTPGHALATAAVVTAGTSGDHIPLEDQEQPIVSIKDGEHEVETLDCGPTTTTAEASNSAGKSESVSGTNITSSDGVNEGQGGTIDERKTKEKVDNSGTPTKTSTASKSGSVTKSRKNNKENQPFSRHSPSPRVSYEHALNSISSNKNVEEEIIVKAKDNAQAVGYPTHNRTTTATTEDVNGKEEVIVITTTTTTTEDVNNNKSASASSSTSGPGSIPSKKDPKGKGKAKAVFPPPSTLPPPLILSASAGPSSTSAAGPSSPKISVSNVNPRKRAREDSEYGNENHNANNHHNLGNPSSLSAQITKIYSREQQH
ncbi:hypothetical protein SMACR_08781 [Sordaria macrospora]|uniref:WGS project CABT00000000 data, contig 2.15 n=2 Tax=Sordaria macrospora TaxID=5147 RepID=F7VZR0_SORMK|nr:uncharacterized protein SMAC_08781 [Sordaria macrospora k-hell]KAA8623902.1 hypothetical protein SMACR_08781 [Sordaria macrospora]WPJ62532.1 hypothetical protein SMAC4_08781 [Sordaria macrospora]CCC11009.1 unnamed protein product [Sordaria macrospora k-hell]